MEIQVCTVEDMHALGKRLARACFPGCVIALNGGLGAGKTELVRGLASALCPEALVQSPTYALIHEYEGNLPVYHIDLYRLTPSAVPGIGLEDCLYGDGVCAIEWASVAPECLPQEHLEIDIQPGATGKRSVRLRACGEGYQQMLSTLQEIQL